MKWKRTSQRWPLGGGSRLKNAIRRNTITIALSNVSRLRSSCENFPRVFSCYIQLPPPPDPLIRLPWGHFRLCPTEMRGPPSHLTWELDKTVKAAFQRERMWWRHPSRSVCPQLGKAPSKWWPASRPSILLRWRCPFSPVRREERD